MNPNTSIELNVRLFNEYIEAHKNEEGVLSYDLSEYFRSVKMPTCRLTTLVIQQDKTEDVRQQVIDESFVLSPLLNYFVFPNSCIVIGISNEVLKFIPDLNNMLESCDENNSVSVDYIDYSTKIKYSNVPFVFVEQRINSILVKPLGNHLEMPLGTYMYKHTYNQSAKKLRQPSLP